MKQRNHRLIATALAAVLSVGMAFPTSASAQNTTEKTEIESFVSVSDSRSAEFYLVEREKSLYGIPSRYTTSYSRSNLNVNGKKISTHAITVNGITYIPLSNTAEALGATYTYNQSSRSMTVKMNGLVIVASDGCYTTYANDRALFSLSPNILMNDGKIYIPASVFAKATGQKVSAVRGSVSIDGTVKPISHASSYYKSDEVFWLARIIEAESGGEPLLGKIAVGNVVMNRVYSSQYPNTIWSVIFDRKYGVQFSPVLDGRIYNDPSYNSLLAAKIVLDGFDISDGALFFLRPEISSSSWIPNNRPYAFSIGKHDFYK